MKKRNALIQYIPPLLTSMSRYDDVDAASGFSRLPYFFVYRSTRPAESTSFCFPVKKG
jgi:hypothetical protein